MVLFMPPLPVIAGAYRITLLWNNFDGIAPRNVLHVVAASGTVDDVADAFDAAMTSGINVGMFAVMNNSHFAGSFEILPLDGSTAQQSHDFTNSPRGGAAADITPAVCAVMSWHTAQRGPRGRGRTYIGPVREEAVTAGLFDATVQGNLVDAWAEFHDNLRSGSPILVPVVASYTHADAHEITSIRCDGVAGTQRRRQDQLR